MSQDLNVRVVRLERQLNSVFAELAQMRALLQQALQANRMAGAGIGGGGGSSYEWGFGVASEDIAPGGTGDFVDSTTSATMTGTNPWEVTEIFDGDKLRWERKSGVNYLSVIDCLPE